MRYVLAIRECVLSNSHKVYSYYETVDEAVAVGKAKFAYKNWVVVNLDAVDVEQIIYRHDGSLQAMLEEARLEYDRISGNQRWNEERILKEQQRERMRLEHQRRQVAERRIKRREITIESANWCKEGF